METINPYVVKQLSTAHRLLKAAGPALLTVFSFASGIAYYLEHQVYELLLIGLIFGGALGYLTFRLWAGKEEKILDTAKTPEAARFGRILACVMAFLGFFSLLGAVPDQPNQRVMFGLLGLFFLIDGGLLFWFERKENSVLPEVPEAKRLDKQNDTPVEETEFELLFTRLCALPFLLLWDIVVIAGAIGLEIIWLVFLFGSVLGVILLLIFWADGFLLPLALMKLAVPVWPDTIRQRSTSR